MGCGGSSSLQRRSQHEQQIRPTTRVQPLLRQQQSAEQSNTVNMATHRSSMSVVAAGTASCALHCDKADKVPPLPPVENPGLYCWPRAAPTAEQNHKYAGPFCDRDLPFRYCVLPTCRYHAVSIDMWHSFIISALLCTQCTWALTQTLPIESSSGSWRRRGLPLFPQAGPNTAVTSILLLQFIEISKIHTWPRARA